MHIYILAVYMILLFFLLWKIKMYYFSLSISRSTHLSIMFNVLLEEIPIITLITMFTFSFSFTLGSRRDCFKSNIQVYMFISSDSRFQGDLKRARLFCDSHLSAGGESLMWKIEDTKGVGAKSSIHYHLDLPSPEVEGMDTLSR